VDHAGSGLSISVKNTFLGIRKPVPETLSDHVALYRCLEPLLGIGKIYWERIDILAGVIYEIFTPIQATTVTAKE
jgi:hypothetical protein